MHPNQADIEAAIRSYHDPYLRNNLLDTGCLESLQVDHGRVKASFALGYPAEGLCEGVAQMLASKIEDVAGVVSADVSVHWQVTPAAVQGELEADGGGEEYYCRSFR